MPETDPLAELGLSRIEHRGRLRVWSASATSMELCLLDESGERIVRTKPMRRDRHGVWQVASRRLQPGTRYAVRVNGPSGPQHAFDPHRLLLDPYARAVVRTEAGNRRAVVPHPDHFDWGGVGRPGTPLDRTVIYEAHVKGISRLNPQVPEQLRGTYAGLAHPATIDYLTGLGVTAVQLLPVQQFAHEQRLREQGTINYWGYNTLSFFAPHAAYASLGARQAGPEAVLREFKGMVRLLHQAGLEVILDVVYNHTAEEGRGGPTTCFRGLDNAHFYRQGPDGGYLNNTGTGNALNTATPAVQRLVLDSLRYWAQEVHIDGFRFDLAAALGRNGQHEFDPGHPLLTAIRDDPALAGVKLIAEPWDVGPGGWQVGSFPAGWSEWNDGFRDRMRSFWLTDVAAARATGSAPSGIGPLARRLAGSAHVFDEQRGPLASVNFITAHDGFTLADLTAFETKRNLANGEDGRDGTDSNRSFNHGIEGPTDDGAVLAARRKAIRNLLGTLLLAAGVPMLTAGDEFGRSQAGNNNPYNQDGPLTWLAWERTQWQQELLAVSRRLIALRRDNPALRPQRYGRWGETVPGATQMDWYNKAGQAMTMQDWDSPAERTLQYLAATTPEHEEFNRILLVVHGLEEEVEVTLPAHEGVHAYTLLWDSARDDAEPAEHEPGTQLRVAPTSMMMFRAH